MRADRLMSIVMLLQTHRRMTAAQLSAEVEVSLRTIYRDLIALSTAGVPVYTDRGPGGGISLLESYQTTLTGMSEDEARALFMLSIPEVLDELGVGQKLKTALLKLAVALPPGQSLMLARTQQRIYLDSLPWAQLDEPTPHLGIIQQAIWQDKLMWLQYKGSFDAKIEITLAALGLVAKLNTWYLVGKTEGYFKVIAVRDILEAVILEKGYIRDDDFDLEDFWKAWCMDYQRRRPVYKVLMKASPGIINKMKFYVEDTEKFSVVNPDSPGPNGWVLVSVEFEHFFRARECILNMGRSVQVLEPEALRLSIIDYAQQIVDIYKTGD